MTWPSRPGACRSWRSSWWPGGGRRHQPRGPAHAAPRGGRHLSAAEDLEDLERPAVCGEEGPRRAPVRDRRPGGDPRRRRTGSDLLPGRVRALEPAAPVRPAVGRHQRQEQGTRPGAAAPDPATCTRTAGVRHLFAAYDLREDKLYGHIKPRKTRTRFLEFCRYLRSLYPPGTRIAIICDNFSPHLSTAKDARAGHGPRRATSRSPAPRLIRPC